MFVEGLTDFDEVLKYIQQNTDNFTVLKHLVDMANPALNLAHKEGNWEVGAFYATSSALRLCSGSYSQL